MKTLIWLVCGWAGFTGALEAGQVFSTSYDMPKFSGWVYLSEVTFFDTPGNVPDRGLTLAMLGMAIALLAFINRKLKD